MRETIATLRKKVLTLAVSGQLVHQDPTEGTGEELYQAIQKARTEAAKTATGRKKNAKPLPPITPEEIPFEIPESWKWVRLGEVTNYGSAEKCKPGDITEGTWVLELEDIDKDGRGLLIKRTYPDRKSLSDKNLFREGDVLYGKLRPYLNKVVCATEGGVASSELLPLRFYGGGSGEYLRLVLLSDYFSTHVNARTYGMKMPRLGTEDGRKSLITLPPSAEQHRIVAKVEEIMQTLDLLEQEANDVESVLDLLEKRILTEAVSGKLVPQDPTEGTGEELYQAIQKARTEAAKTATGRKKNAKPLPPITPEEIPFEIPDTWTMARLLDLADVQYGYAFDSNKFSDDTGVPLIRIRDIFSQATTKQFTGTYSKEYLVSTGDIIVGMDGDFNVTRWRGKEALLNQRVCRFRNYSDGFCDGYLLIILPEILKRIHAGTAFVTVKHLSAKEINKIQIPLPPLAEQRRIVAKVDEAISLIKHLREAVK